MSTILECYIDGDLVPLGEIAYPIQCTHGRAGITDGPTPSTARLILKNTATPVELSDIITWTATGPHTRFTGIITDLTPSTRVDNGERFLEITAVGTLTDIGLEPVEADAWPEETSEERAARILDASGVPAYTVTGSLTVLAETSGTKSGLDWLTQLAADTGAAVVDLPDGSILFQDLEERRQRYIPDPTLPDPVTIPAAVIEWEPSLQQHRGTIVNRITVTYGDPEASVTLNDVPSQEIHKLRPGTLSTRLANADDATTRATTILSRLANPRYVLGAVTVRVHELDATTRADVLNIVCGDRVIVTGLPDGYPLTDWLGVVEGWTEVITWNTARDEEEHFLTLALSDPRASFAGLNWDEIPAGFTWDDIPAGRMWADVVTLESLGI